MSLADPFRFYFFGLHYMSSIQQGIQGGHAASNFTLRLLENGFSAESFGPVRDTYVTWAKQPTVILLNGGFSRKDGTGSLNYYESITSMLGEVLNLPHASFREIEMEGCLSSVGIIVPQSIFEARLDATEINFPSTRSMKEMPFIVCENVATPDVSVLTLPLVAEMTDELLATWEGTSENYATARFLLLWTIKSAKLAS